MFQLIIILCSFFVAGAFVDSLLDTFAKSHKKW